MNRLVVGCSLIALALGSVAGAQVSIVTPEPLECMPPNGHTVVWSDVDPVPNETDEVRIYFRRQGFGDFYYVIMEVPDDDVPTRYRGVVPVPEPDNEYAEYYLGVVNEAGTLLSRSETSTIPILDDCDVETDDGYEFVVGETSAAQEGRKIAWWQCEDVTARIDVYGEQRDEGACVPIIYWWQRPEIVVPVALGTVGSIILIDDILEDDPPPPVSPSSP